MERLIVFALSLFLGYTAYLRITRRRGFRRF